MRIAIIGASSQSTPALFDSEVCLEESKFSFVLVARNLERLAAVRRAVSVIGRSHGYQVCQECVSMSGLDTALAGADVAIVQIRSGGFRARDWDERFPHRYGQCGDEGLGLGGLAAAWRTWPELHAILERIAVARPQALVLLLTSPVGILTRCALDAFPQLRLYGICELPWTTLLTLCGDDFSVARNARFAYAGVNHLGWFSNVRSSGRVLLGEAEVLPLKYVCLAEEPERVMQEQLRHPSRADELERIGLDAFRAYRFGSRAEVVAAVRARPTPWYANAIAPLLAGLIGSDDGPPFFLTHRNESYCTWLDESEVIEMPFTCRAAELERGELGAWYRDDVASKLISLVRYERLAAEAVRTRAVGKLATAIGEHPWLEGVPVQSSLLDDLMASPTRIARAEIDGVVV